VKSEVLFLKSSVDVNDDDLLDFNGIINGGAGSRFSS
jgi:hypothetical protein